jgi:selenocysteine lyase/cysteine desulfurase
MIADPNNLPRNEPYSDGWSAERYSPDKPLDDSDWRNIRAKFDLRAGWTFLNHGTLGPTPRGVSDVYHSSIDELAHDPASNHRDSITAIRARLAGFINADVDEVALTRSTTEGMNILAHGLDWSAGDEVIIGTHEHFAGVQPYQTSRDRAGIRIVEIDVPAPPATVDQIVAAYESAVTPKTRLIVVSHVSYVTGLIAPIRELTDLAHRKGLLISVDGAQSFGVLQLDLHASGVDHYAGSGQKWFLAGTGTGFSYIRRQLHELVWPSSGYHDLKGDQHGPYTNRTKH